MTRPPPGAVLALRLSHGATRSQDQAHSDRRIEPFCLCVIAFAAPGMSPLDSFFASPVITEGPGRGGQKKHITELLHGSGDQKAPR